MAGFKNSFPWPSYYGHFNFFEQRMRSHKAVASLAAGGDGLYSLLRSSGDQLRIFICECYAFGVAEYMDTVSRLGQINVVIINSDWCGYSHEAKRHCREERVGLFKIGEFMSALHRSDYWNYLTQSEKEYFEEKGWL